MMAQCPDCLYEPPEGQEPPDWIAKARRLHIAFNVATRLAGGTPKACDGPECSICRRIALETSVSTATARAATPPEPECNCNIESDFTRPGCPRHDPPKTKVMTRDQLKKEYHDYQDAAQKMATEIPNVSVPDHASVHVAADRDGAFVDAVIWVPKEKIE